MLLMTSGRNTLISQLLWTEKVTLVSMNKLIWVNQSKTLAPTSEEALGKSWNGAENTQNVYEISIRQLFAIFPAII